MSNYPGESTPGASRHLKYRVWCLALNCPAGLQTNIVMKLDTMSEVPLVCGVNSSHAQFGIELVTPSI